MEQYRTLLLTHAVSEVGQLLQSSPEPQTELDKIKSWLSTTTSGGGNPSPIIVEVNSTAPDIVIGWFVNTMFNPDGDFVGTFSELGQQVREALNLPEWQGGNQGASVLLARLSDAVYNMEAASAANPQAGAQIEAALTELMNALPSVEDVNEFAVAWINQAVFATAVVVIPTLEGTRQLGTDIKGLIQGATPQMDVQIRKPSTTYASRSPEA